MPENRRESRDSVDAESEDENKNNVTHPKKAPSMQLRTATQASDEQIPNQVER